MKVLDDGNTIEIRFSPLRSITIDRKEKEIKVGKKSIKFSEVKGFWKNYRYRGKRRVFYVVLLTPKAMERITPEMDEYDVDEVIGYLKEILGDDKYGR